MSLEKLMSISTSSSYDKKQGLSQERIRNQLPNLRNLIAFYREYPDYLVDYLKGPESTFNFYFY